ncbi:MAG: hypothetical protein ACKOSS_04235 [Planctomycetia bacterium]
MDQGPMRPLVLASSLLLACMATTARADEPAPSPPQPVEAAPVEPAPAREAPARAAPAPVPARTDLALRLLALEHALLRQPEAFVARKREIALKVGTATAGFFMGNFRGAMDAIGEAHALLEQRPWDAQRAALARLRVLLPAALPLGDVRARLATLRLVPLGPAPEGASELVATATWRPSEQEAPQPAGSASPAGRASPVAPAPPAAARAVAAWLEQGVAAASLPTQPGLWTVEVRLGDVVLHGRTAVVADNTPQRLAVARTALEALPAPVEGTPGGVLPTLQRLARQLVQGLAGQGGDVVPDLARALARLEEGVAGLEAQKPGTPYRPSRAALAGDSHRVTASGQRYRLYVPPAASGAADAPLPLVLALHGAGGTEDMYFEAYGAGEALRQARARGWVLAAPDDSDASLEVLADLQQLLSIDPARTYLTGHSMGAGAAWRAAIASPQSFTAVACVAGGWMSAGRPDYSRLGSLPLLSITASLDMSRRMAEGTARTALAAGAKVEERLYDDLDHLLVVGCSLPDVFTWLEGHVRR